MSAARPLAPPAATATSVQAIANPNFADSRPIDWFATSLALQLILKLGGKFNLRRDINDVMGLSARSLHWPLDTLERLHRFLVVRCAEMDGWQGLAQLTPEQMLQQHGYWNGNADSSTIFYFIDEFVKTDSKALHATFSATVRELAPRLLTERVLIRENIARLATVLSLTAAEADILLYAAVCKAQRDMRSVLVDCKAQSAQEAYALLGDLLGHPTKEVAAALKAGSRLDLLGLIDTPLSETSVTDLGDLMRVSDKLISVLVNEYASDQAMMATFTKPAPATELVRADFDHVSADAGYLIALIKNATQRQQAGVNVLIYGAPGTGKTEFARLVAREAATELYEVDCADAEGGSMNGRERYRALQVAQAFLKGRLQTALLFDEVEDVFPMTGAGLAAFLAGDEKKGSVAGKAWVNQTLENNPVPTLWICNEIEQIDPAYLRRFQFHLEMKAPPTEAKSRMLKKALVGLDLPAAFLDKLAQQKALTPAQIRAAARFADLVGSDAGTASDAGQGMQALIERQLANAHKAIGIKQAAKERPVVTTYDLSLLNLETRYPVEKIIHSLAVRPRSTMIFYGLPGTGKTALGEHIAKAIDRPLMIRRASDIISKWVGETEQNMAAMFAEAESEKAVLLLDEADTFLQNRAMAQRSYEVSEVNEMLQGMERFDGIFICTTNLFDRIDEAALRRFTFKIRFQPLTAEQRERMFVREVLEGVPEQLTGALKARLAKLVLLAPGDFAAVKRQTTLLGEALEPGDFLTELEREHAVKPDVKFSKPMGFA